MAPEFCAPRGLLAILIAAAGLTIHPAAGSAHGPIHEQIHQISRDIDRAPGYADLYLARAGLYRLDQDWVRAEADLEKAEQLGASSTAVSLTRVEIKLDRQEYDKALAILIPLRRLASTEVRFAHVRAYEGLGDPESALFWLNLCLRSTGTVPADWYLRRSGLVLEIDPQNVEEALAGLEDGLATRGFDVALALRCLDLESGSGRYDQALDRLSTLEAIYQRDEELLSRRGDILNRAGRHLEAETAYTEALSALESLPPSRRSTPATQELENHLRSALEESSTN